MMRQIILIGFWCLLFISSACKKESGPEERIMEEFYRIKEYVQQKKIGKIMDYISSDYRDIYGNSKDSIKAILIQNILFRNSINVFIRDLDLKIDGGRAEVALKLFLSESGGIIPENADFILLKCKMIDAGDKWVIISAQWEGHQSPF